jgi:acyl-CoA reductase-like NAD-dependent aldehyde dehydrogenase
MKMYVAGEWTGSNDESDVTSPYSGDVVDTVPNASEGQVERAVAAAVEGARQMAALTPYERGRILERAATMLEGRLEELARLLTLEEGKPLVESRAEVSRVPDLLRLCAFEASQLRGETLPLEAASNGAGKLGFTMRVPCGVVVAITPFNFPVLLAVHKIGPALAAGNAVILKPAGLTPLTGLKLTELFLDAGLPENGLQCLTGAGSSIGPRLCADARVRKISFTGSTAVGEAIARVAGVKRLSLELGSNCPVIVLPDADIERVAGAVAVGGYANAGQVCISTQRVLVDRRVYGDVIDALVEKVAAIPTGDPLEESTRLSAMVSEQEAERVGSWIDDAVCGGARVVTGGERDGAVFSPTVVADVDPTMRISCDELFGPAVAVTPVAGVDEALAVANDSRYGLSAGIFTRDLDVALRFAREAESGNIHLNGTPTWRADLMPYGGLKESGLGKEGPRYAVEAMTESKTIVFHER